MLVDTRVAMTHNRYLHDKWFVRNLSQYGYSSIQLEFWLRVGCFAHKVFMFGKFSSACLNK